MTQHLPDEEQITSEIPTVAAEDKIRKYYDILETELPGLFGGEDIEAGVSVDSVEIPDMAMAVLLSDPQRSLIELKVALHSAFAEFSSTPSQDFSKNRLLFAIRVFEIFLSRLPSGQLSLISSDVLIEVFSELSGIEMTPSEVMIRPLVKVYVALAGWYIFAEK